MKRIFIVVNLVLIALNAAAAPVEPYRTLTAPWASNTPAMDGVADFDYSEIQTTEIFNPTGYEGEADFTATFQICFDLQFLYLLATITDDVDHSYQWNTGNPWEFDNIEIFLQLDTNTVTTSYNSTTVQLRICRGLDSVESAGRAPRNAFIYYMEGAAAGGWITEVAIPWTAVLAAGSEPDDMQEYFSAGIGFDFAGADSDNSDTDPDVGNRDVQSAWDMDDPSDEADRTEDLAWNNTSVFGYIYLYNLCCDEYPILSLEEPSPESRIRILPNPAEASIQLQDVEEAGTLIIYNLQGVAVQNVKYIPDEEVDVSGLSSGLYTIVLNGTTGGRFIKQ